jgi:hypothetical protein
MQVVGRVRMQKVLNPEAWFDRSTYLKVQVEDMPDTDLEVRSQETLGRNPLGVRRSLT